MNHAMFAVIKKDFRGITANKRLFSSLWIVPLMLTVVLPSILTLAIHFAPEDPDFRKLLEMLPSSGRSGTPEHIIAGMILDYILPVFFLIVPIMAASVMAASSFVGEKEKHTLETLLYCPLSVKQIFQAKVLASFFLSMLVSLLSFGAMLLVLETELFFLSGTLLLPGSSWAVILLLVSPAISDRQKLCKIPEHGRIPAGRRLSGSSCRSADCRPVCRSSAAEYSGSSGNRCRLRAAGRSAAEKIHEPVHL